jgi:phosphoribosylformylglycinamidine synthase
LEKPYQLNLKKNKLKFSVKITLKKNVLDPQGKIVQQTLQNMGMDTLKTLRQGKYFEIDVNENDETIATNKIEEMCNKLLVNLIIEDFKISKV